MKKVGSIYLKTSNKENNVGPLEIPTRRKESIDNKSNYTAASLYQYQIKSTSNGSHSCSQFTQSEDTVRDAHLEEYHTFG
jgi:hypothetical protein